MSLKAVHVFFIAVATLFALGFGIWSLDAWRGAGGTPFLALAVTSIAAATALAVYGGWFLKKMKDVSYL